MSNISHNLSKIMVATLALITISSVLSISQYALKQNIVYADSNDNQNTLNSNEENLGDLDQQADSYVKLSSDGNFYLDSSAYNYFNSNEIHNIQNQINMSNSIVHSNMSNNATQIDTDNKEIVISDTNSQPLTSVSTGLQSINLLSKSRKYKEGVTKLVWHWNYVRVFISRSVLRDYGKYEYYGNTILNGINRDTIAQVVYRLTFIPLAKMPGGIYFDLNYLDMGITANDGFAGIATDVIVNAITNRHWQ